ncbi:TIGR01777 family oxidoreductase [Sulfurimonas sp.]|uniref:TIGR01777 family oxidoreductase n=1 Tax=Sulfurimonas sp. TaxID=2022749 RepID=UPI003D0FD1E0
MKVAISGVSGFVGTHLLKTFPNFVSIARDDTKEQILQKLQDVDIVINLAGAPIIKKWSQAYKKVLISSRVETTKKLVSAINESDVKYFISTSAIGAYPDDEVHDESFNGYANDFLGALTKEWEQCANECIKPTAIVRFGIVLGNDGGALKQMLLPFKLGVGGIISDGKMVMSWIDIDDLVSIYQFLIGKKLTGVFNAVAPNPVANYEFTKTLGRVLHRPTIFPLPEFVLKIIYGEAASVLIGSKEIYPKNLTQNGFKFKYSTIKESLEHLIP